MPVRFGIDHWITTQPKDLKNSRLGLVTSNAATCAFNGETSRVALRRAGFNLVRLFGPEHGLSASAPDGAHVTDSTDPATNLPVLSLYGDHVRPTAESLSDLDAVAYDIPDVGARFYTYIWTLSHMMEACAEAGKPIYVLDRPNPIGGNLADAEGPELDEQNLSSFVGRWNIPIRYSLTIGELAQLWNAERKLGADLHIVSVSGWRRHMQWPDTNLNFIKLSPAMPSYKTALLYPGTCLFEGTNLSEGRGTPSPFALIGAPWLNATELANEFNAQSFAGIRAEATTFTPRDRKYVGETYHGIQLHITSPKLLRPVSIALNLLATIIKLHPREFAWIPYPTAANTQGHQHFDRLIGQLHIRKQLEAGTLAATVTACPTWPGRAAPYLLYD